MPMTTADRTSRCRPLHMDERQKEKTYETSDWYFAAAGAVPEPLRLRGKEGSGGARAGCGRGGPCHRRLAGPGRLLPHGVDHAAQRSKRTILPGGAHLRHGQSLHGGDRHLSGRGGAFPLSGHGFQPQPGGRGDLGPGRGPDGAGRCRGDEPLFLRRGLSADAAHRTAPGLLFPGHDSVKGEALSQMQRHPAYL